MLTIEATTKNPSEGGVDVFYTNPNFISDVEKDCYDEMSRDELVAKLIEQKKLIRKQARKLTKQNAAFEQMKAGYLWMQKRAEHHREQLSYKDKTLTLYKRILESYFLKPTDQK